MINCWTVNWRSR